MKALNVASVVAALVLGATVAGVSALGVEVHDRYAQLEHPPAYQLEQPPQAMKVPEPQEVDTANLHAQLTAAAENPALGSLHGRVTDTSTGEVVWEQVPDQAVTPASATKILTGAAATLTLDSEQRILTEVVQGQQPGTVVITASGDVWLTPERIAELAAQITQPVTQVTVDTSQWEGEEIAPAVRPDNVDAGYIAPMQPVMIHQGRIGASEGDVPRSHTPALDVAWELAGHLGAETVAVGPAPDNAEVLATTESEPLRQRVEDMMKFSDNVMAEAIAREVATARGAEASFGGAASETLRVLEEAGFNTNGVVLADNSGMSTENLIPAALLDDILVEAVTGEELRPLLGDLPVASGVGTLEARFGDLPGRGWVRAKTGTLTGVNALAGTVTGESGRVYTFALLSNGGEDTLAARRALDQFASVIRSF